ncbi:hypothetical protein ABKW28_03470 [Nocardioides sp. 31GB23]
MVRRLVGLVELCQPRRRPAEDPRGRLGRLRLGRPVRPGAARHRPAEGPGPGAGEEAPEGGPTQQAGTGKADTTGGAEKDRRKSGKQEKADRAGQGAEGADDETETETDDQDTVVDLDGTEPTAAPVDDPAGLPVWVAPAVLVLLGAGLAGLAVVRRRRRG